VTSVWFFILQLSQDARSNKNQTHCHVGCNVFHMEKEIDLDLNSCRIS